MSGDSRILEQIRREQEGLTELFKSRKISEASFKYLMGKLDEELRKINRGTR